MTTLTRPPLPRVEIIRCGWCKRLGLCISRGKWHEYSIREHACTGTWPIERLSK